MIRMMLAVALVPCMTIQASTLEMEIPEVPKDAAQWMPTDTESFLDGLTDFLQKAIQLIQPELYAAASGAVSILICAMLLAMIRSYSKKHKQITDLAGTAIITVILFGSANIMIHLAEQTIQELSSYGKLILPVMTAATAAQGYSAVSGAVYSGTVLFDAILGSLLSDILIPAVSFFLVFAIGYAATKELLLKRIREIIRSIITWSLKSLITIYITYMSITGVISGTADAAALKAAKMTISTVVPVVGNILSDASEAVLVSAGILKNAAGIYGIFAFLAIIVSPFVQIGAQYLVMKATAAVIGIFQEDGVTALVEDFSAAMGFLLAITGVECVFLLVSIICFMKGA